MGNQFSFYQYDGLIPDTTSTTPFAYTGDVGNRVVVWSGSLSPITAPYFDSFIGYYITASLLEGGQAGFIWQLFDEFSSHPPVFKAKVSGELKTINLQRVSFNNNIYGSLYPLIKESGELSINVTGEIQQDKHLSFFQSSYSGYVTSGTKDFPLNAINYSGETISGTKDFPNIGQFISGSLISISNDHPVYAINFSGNINKGNSDFGSIGCSFDSVSYSLYVVFTIIATGSDVMNMTTQFSSVIYRYDN